MDSVTPGEFRSFLSLWFAALCLKQMLLGTNVA